jgi:hypothetical protein
MQPRAPSTAPIELPPCCSDEPFKAPSQAARSAVAMARVAAVPTVAVQIGVVAPTPA